MTDRSRTGSLGLARATAAGGCRSRLGRRDRSMGRAIPNETGSVRRRRDATRLVAVSLCRSRAFSRRHHGRLLQDDGAARLSRSLWSRCTIRRCIARSQTGERSPILRAVGWLGKSGHPSAAKTNARSAVCWASSRSSSWCPSGERLRRCFRRSRSSAPSACRSF